jgi:glycosyltransferase involved in cell wall biosynthesis
MKNKKNILYVIDSFAIGGAEMSLATTLNYFTEYNITLVYLKPEHNLIPLLNPGIKKICLNYSGKNDFFKAVLQVRRIIKEQHIDIVHAQLYWSTLIARLATPRQIKFVFTLQNLMSLDAFNSKLAWVAEKLTYSKKETVIGVSLETIKDYHKFIGIKGHAYLVHNPIDDKYFSVTKNLNNSNPPGLKLIAVGNLRAQKNYFYLLEAFKHLVNENVTVDIYGEGTLRGELQAIINKFGLKVTLKGHSKNLEKILPEYDAFVMTSNFEGCAIAALEAMAVKLPALLSDIPVLRELGDANAIYFDLKNPTDLATQIKKILSGTIDLNQYSNLSYERASQLGRRDVYLKKIREIYENEKNSALNILEL